MPTAIKNEDYSLFSREVCKLTFYKIKSKCLFMIKLVLWEARLVKASSKIAQMYFFLSHFTILVLICLNSNLYIKLHLQRIQSQLGQKGKFNLDTPRSMWVGRANSDAVVSMSHSARITDPLIRAQQKFRTSLSTFIVHLRQADPSR